MKLAFSMVVKDDEQAVRMLEMVRAGGFEGVEPTFGLEATLPVAGDPRTSAEKLKKMADKIGLTIPSMRGGPGFWPTFASVDPQQRKRAVELASKAMEAVKIMGGDTLLIVPGQWDASCTYKQTWDAAVETGRTIAEIAEKVGMKVGLENVENRFLMSPRDWVGFLDEIGSKWVRMYFDVGNVVYLKQGWPDQWMRELSKAYITRIHIKGATNDGKLVNLKEGAVNWLAVRGAMNEIGYENWVGVELAIPTGDVMGFFARSYRDAREILS